MSWVLVLTIWAGLQQGSAIASVPGFKSEADCKIAGAAWLQQSLSHVKPTYLCVKQ